MKPLVRLLEMGATAPGVVAAALDALRAATMNNEDNKAAAAASWLVPQLVKLIGSEVCLQSLLPLLSVTVNDQTQLARSPIKLIGFRGVPSVCLKPSK